MFILRIILLLLCFIKSGCANELGDITAGIDHYNIVTGIIDNYSQVWNKINASKEDPDTGSHHVFSYMLEHINKKLLFKMFLLLDKEYWGAKDMDRDDLAYIIANIRCLLFSALNENSSDELGEEELAPIFIVEHENMIRQLYTENTGFLSQFNHFYRLLTPESVEQEDDLSFEQKVKLYHASFFLLNQQHIKDEVKNKADFFRKKSETIFQDRIKKLVFEFDTEATELYNLLEVDRDIFLNCFILACRYLYYHIVCDDDVFDLFSRTPGLITKTVKSYQQATEYGKALLQSIKKTSKAWNIYEGETQLPILDLNAELEVEDEQGWTPFINAVLLRPDNLYQRLINLGANINAQDREGKTALYLCFQKNLFERGETLIKNGADIYMRDNQHMTVFDLMVNEGNVKGIKILLKYIDDLNNSIEFINGERYQYVPAIFYAVNKGRLSILDLLLNAGADPNYGCPKTPLLCTAVSKGYPEIVNFLLKHQCDINVQDIAGETPLACILSANKFDSNLQNVAEILIRNKADPNISDHFQNTPLHKAVKYNADFANFEDFIKRIDFFLKNNSDIEALNDLYQTPLLYSISAWKKRYTQQIYDFDQYDENRLIRIIKMLLDAGANINAKDIHFNNALFYAIQKQYFYVCKFLLDHTRIDINEVNNMHETCLLNALANNYSNCVNLLLMAHAEVNCQNREGETPLMLAIMNHDAEIFYQLLERDANKYAKNNKGESVLQYVIKEHFYEGLDLLLYSHLSVLERWKGVYYAHKISEIVAKTILFKNLMHLNILRYSSNKYQQMLAAINSNQYRLIQLLLDSHIDMNRRLFLGQTFLVNATLKDLGGVVSLLIDRGAQCDIQDDLGNTALMYAVKKQFWGIARRLIAARANAVIANTQYENPLIVLVKNKKYDLERLYMQHNPALITALLKQNPSFMRRDLALVKKSSDFLAKDVDIHYALAKWLEKSFDYAIQRFAPVDDESQMCSDVIIPLISLNPNAIYTTIQEKDGSFYEGWVGENSIPSIGDTGTVEGIWTQANGEFFDWYQLCAMKRIVP